MRDPETRRLLAETAARSLASMAPSLMAPSLAEGWRELEQAGLAFATAEEAEGGIGAGFAEIQTILYAAGAATAALPLAEALFAALLMRGAGLALSGPVSLARTAAGGIQNGRFTGVLSGVAYGDACPRVVGILDQGGQLHTICLAGAAGVGQARRSNAATVPFSDLAFEGAEVAAMAPYACGLDPTLLMAFGRACQIGGAADAALDLASGYVAQREQFGRPLAKFQAIQQQMAVMAEECAAANAAAMAAAAALDEGTGVFAARCAVVRAMRAAGEVASIAHQVHGAIGFTREYELQRLTRALWSWRSECGNERAHAVAVGQIAARAGAQGFWPALVAGFASAQGATA